MNIAKNLERSAFFFPSRPVVSEGASEISFAQLNARANRMATALIRLGVQPGDPVALCAPNSGDWLAFYFGVLKAGGVAVTLSSLLKTRELALSINESLPKIICTYEDKLDDLKGMKRAGVLEKIICPGGDLDLDRLADAGSGSFKAVERDRSDTAAILFTGGTTGIAKGVLLTHENISTAIQNVVFNERSNENDRALCFLPFNHVFGQMHIMNATLLSGGCLELLPSFDMEKVLNAMSAGRVTRLFAVPTVYVRLLSVDHIKEKLGSVRYCFSAAASMAAEIVRHWKDETGLSIHEAYGMTESASMVTYNHYYRHVVGSVGTPVSGEEVQIRDLEGNIRGTGEEGEICIRGRNIMKGYLNKPEETASVFWGEWFRSGDIGQMDDHGYLYIVDRLKDMIISGGENVYPRDIEEVLYSLPEVEECTVIGLPDKEWGERVTALIIPKPGMTIDATDLATRLKTRLSPFKVPKEYHVVKEFPKSAAGKILKRELRKQYLKTGAEPRRP
ncbi:MAG: long-chain acyl-CoA synthetase [Thermodesulfobacteriota bacterium]|nr:long-chain acyl-CoA synthetase [Thermodesulfobacteriota bacterium]